MMAALPLVLATVVAAGADGQIIKERFSSGGAQRSYHLFVPVGGARPAPLIVLLHGSGRDGRSLAEPWRQLAAKEGIMLAAPDSFKRESWGMREDGPHFLHGLIETISEKHPVDRRRSAWTFLKGYQLPGEPKYQVYAIPSR